MNETLRSDLSEAKGHAKEAARATLLAMRGALDFAIDKLSQQGDAPEGEPAATGASKPAASEPEGGMAAPSMPDDKPATGPA